MFTGLIEKTGAVTFFKRSHSAALLGILTPLPVHEIALGDSVAVNGICLTVTDNSNSVLTFDVSPESISRSTFSTLQTGDRVNLERAMRLGDRLGGHIVTGHVDCTATVVKSAHVSGYHILTFALPARFCRYLVPKGSVAIDGISLTVNDVSNEEFTVTVIPHTFDHTTLAHVQPGNRVNIETDILGKYIERLAQPWRDESGLSMQTLAENGFI